MNNWSVIATHGIDNDSNQGVTGVAVDGTGNLYVAGPGNVRVQMYTPDR
jgi:sugar lactone lactonase YvrE